MEIPEKIYLTSNDNEAFVFTQKRTDNKGVEYIRTDAFVDKVYEWLNHYAFVDDDDKVHLPTLLHDFYKDSRTF